MKSDIIAFVTKVCQKFNLRCIYIPDAQGTNDVWSITTKSGHAVMNFTTAIFYHVPPQARWQMFLPTIKRGLANLVGRSDIRRTQQTIIPRKMGKQIYG